MEKYKNKFLKQLYQNFKIKYLPYIVLFSSSLILSFLIYLFLEGIHFPLDSDIYFHISISEEYSKTGMLKTIPWAIESIWFDGYGDTHFLYHQLLRFFGLDSWKIFIFWGIFANLFSLGCVYHLLHKNNQIDDSMNYEKQSTVNNETIIHLVNKVFSQIPFKNILILQLLFVFLSIPFTGRLLLGRGLLVFLPILFWYYYFLETSSKKGIFILSGIAVWTYPLAPLLGLLGLLKISDGILRKPKEIPFQLKLFGSSILGFLLALFLHPSFPNQWIGYRLEWWDQIIGNPNLEKIQEWNPPSLELYIATFSFCCLYFIYSFNGLVYKKYRYLFIILGLGLVLSFFNTKALEWTVPIFFLVLSINPKLIKSEIFPDKFIPYLYGMWILIFIWQFQNLRESILIHSSIFEKNNIHLTARQICNEKYKNQEKVWIRWNDFPEFSYYCRTKEYPFGLNPLYSFTKNSDRYEMIRRFWKDGSVDSTRLVEYLDYGLVVMNKKRDSSSLIARFKNSDNWELSLSNGDYYVFQKKQSIEQ